MNRAEAIVTLRANVIYACESAGFNVATINLVTKALDLAIEALQKRTGKWIKNENGTYSCSECHSWLPEEQHHYARYCLYCGAKMGGD